jgi:hypothetical protein
MRLDQPIARVWGPIGRRAETFAEGAAHTTTKWDVHHAGLARYRQGMVDGGRLMAGGAWSACGRVERATPPAERDCPRAKGSNNTQASPVLSYTRLVLGERFPLGRAAALLARSPPRVTPHIVAPHTHWHARGGWVSSLGFCPIGYTGYRPGAPGARFFRQRIKNALVTTGKSIGVAQELGLQCVIRGL